MNPALDYLRHLTRRQFFSGSGLALGSVALSCLAGRASAARPNNPLDARVHPPLAGFPHFAPRA